MTGKLVGKSALITGSARGIGRAFAERYTREGATVAIGDIDFERAGEAAKQIGGGCLAIRMDVTEQASIESAVAEAENRLGGIDVLVNNAAVFDAAPIVDITPESFDRLFATNVKGPLFTLQAVARRMIARR